ncbi:hypothetical protein KR222_005402, partial [Zaprionus bogoriensis]
VASELWQRNSKLQLVITKCRLNLTRSNIRSSENSPIVQTTHGAVRGIALKSIYDEQFYQFDGIPYALPPVGELRFRAPQASKPWDGVFDCSQPKDKCLQVSTYTQQIEGSEDCLYLNISVKTFHSEKPLPVMAYVHGGGFKGGDSTRRSWSPDYLMREEVVYISIGYRLGVFGFLSFADPELNIPGNAALKDIVLGLQWIRANVGSFNGDVNNITLFGHSSGSMMVHLLTVCPRTEGLFHKAVLMAGFMPELNRLPDVEYRLAKHLGYEGDNVDSQVYDFLNRADPRLLVATRIFTDAENSHDSDLSAFTPCVEHYATPTGLLFAEPIELQRHSWSNRIPLMLGTTSGEGLSHIATVKKDAKRLQAYREHPEYLLPKTLVFHCDAAKRRQLGRALVEQLCGRPSGGLSEADYLAVARIKTHNMLHYQQRLIHARRAYSQAESYMYRFDFDSPDFNFYRIRYNGLEGPGSRGATHADELCYLFKIPATFELNKSRPEYSTLCRMAAMFAEFARRSNPNAKLTQSLAEWQPLTAVGPTMCLNINEELRFMPQPELESLKFYDQLYEQAAVE